MPDYDRADDFLIVVPPFFNITMPSLAAHIVQDTLARDGVTAQILYANVLTAKLMGFDLYHMLADSNRGLVCERLMALSLAIRGHSNVCKDTEEARLHLSADFNKIIDESNLDIEDWSLDKFLSALDTLEGELIEYFRCHSPKLVAFTSTFESITAVEFIAGIVKAHCKPIPHIVVGGSNADGPMASGLASFFKSVDHIFSGEISSVFSDYCKNPAIWRSGITQFEGLRSPYQERVDFSEFYAQCEAAHYPRMADIWLPLETSRGCWYGEKSHCTFCGLNGTGMKYRSKPSEDALNEYRYYRDKYNPKGFFAIDNIMPREFFEKFLAPISQEAEKVDLFYELKANLTFEQINLIASAGGTSFQPGIEALSTPLLKHMKKGTSAFVNMRTLFWSKQIGVRPAWNLLGRFPGDQEVWYTDTIKILPFIRHLQPPQAVSCVSIERFSPLFERAEEFGIKSVRPISLYSKIFGGEAREADIAYHFDAEFETEYTSKLEADFEDYIREWRNDWDNRTPTVEAFQLKSGDVMIVDTRRTINDTEILVDRANALRGVICDGMSGVGSLEQSWLRDRGLILEFEGRIVNLVERFHVGNEVELLSFSVEK